MHNIYHQELYTYTYEYLQTDIILEKSKLYCCIMQIDNIHFQW